MNTEIDFDELKAVGKELGKAVHWDRFEPEVPEPDLAVDHIIDEGEAFVNLVRSRREPSLGYSRAYVNMLCTATTREQWEEAGRKIERALESPLISGHSNPVAKVGTTDLILGMDEMHARGIAAWVLRNREHWDHGQWGTTRSIIDVLRAMVPHLECPGFTLVPLFGWLLKQLPAEWEWARTWDETVLGNAGHNWWLHTFLGFWQAGLYFPEIADWQKFQAFAPEYFERELSVLMESDGFTRERSGYHWGTLNHWLDYMHIAAGNGISISEQSRRHLVRVAETLWKMRAPNGDVPRHGDAGSAHQPNRTLEKLRIVAATFDMPEAKYVAEKLAPDWVSPLEDALPGQGRNLMPEYRALPVRAPALAPADTELEDSGYYLMRQNWTRESDWMCIEAGPLGAIVTSHDHTHQFNFELYSRGRPVLIDNCSGPYGESTERTWRVSSAAHNVATVDGADHLPMENEWRWNGQLNAFVEDWIKSERYAYFNGAHEGYRRLEEPVASARRKIFYLRGEYWILLDRFVPETDAEHEYTQHLHVDAPCELKDGRLVTTGEGGNLLIVPTRPDSVETNLEPCPHPLEDYENPDHLTFTRTAAGKQVMACLMIPFEGDEAPDVSVRELEIEADARTLAPSEATALEIEIGDRRDTYVDLHMAWNLPWQAGDAGGDRRLYHSAV